MSENIGMYPETKTWNPFVGCKFDCVYCEKSFKLQLKRVGRNPRVFQGIKNIEDYDYRDKRIQGGCDHCYNYEPHYHPERLEKIPSAEIIFICGTGDISFCDIGYTEEIISTLAYRDIHHHKIKRIYYLQSKNPKYFDVLLKRDPPYLHKDFDENVFLLTTLETNRDEGYENISKAPMPTVRFRDFYNLDYPRKIVTIEPVLDYDLEKFVDMINMLHNQGSLEYVWFGFDSKNCGLPEPSIEKAQKFIDKLKELGITVKGKKLKGVRIE